MNKKTNQCNQSIKTSRHPKTPSHINKTDDIYFKDEKMVIHVQWEWPIGIRELDTKFRFDDGSPMSWEENNITCVRGGEKNKTIYSILIQPLLLFQHYTCRVVHLNQQQR